MKTYKQIVSYKRLRSEPAWKLLATDNAPATLALLTTYFTGKRTSST
ncbi:MAG: hypothetical protein GKR92_05390 [Gammaproteobacteria bacterium]|nr:MAG: hypothetical protein GKR92_05390 [Gammaproteobacteria bacterium]